MEFHQNSPQLLISLNFNEISVNFSEISLTIFSRAPIRSYHVLMSILTIGLIVEKFLAAKNFIPINTIASTIGTIASDRMTS